ncbi:hypothetical protein [Nitrospirillum iridis]|uniref:Uncharacterized protein n=1 Tax=Nitrospirillum iridis TaxID=765888 RepID=A0A7X0EHH6_9PROT|nr:hypothetical protein [Nitrospirillum iridis]MBB6254654.1 hypothetical protein [Nitrospirillum iridis]
MTLSSKAQFTVSGIFALAICALVPSVASAGEVKLATPEQALAICKANKMGEWDIAYVIGKNGLVQKGPGHQCAQESAPAQASGVGNAITADGAVVKLATPEEALAMCKANKMGEWDIAYIIGKNALAQKGPGYQCKQESMLNQATGVGNALTP